MHVSKFRDLTLMQIDQNRFFTIACDSCGGIGSSEMDLIKVEDELVGYFTARVCLIETLAFRSKPNLLINTLCVEMEGRGKRLLTGIKRAIQEYYDAFSKSMDINITGSTEENIPTLQTALGITVMGETMNALNRPIANIGDAVVLIGLPKVGQEVIDDISGGLNEMINFNSINLLSTNSNVIDILPVGSKGIRYELNLLQETHNKIIHKIEELKIDLEKSAGPATCVLAVVREQALEDVVNQLNQPITLIGKLT